MSNVSIYISDRLTINIEYFNHSKISEYLMEYACRYEMTFDEVKRLYLALRYTTL